MTKNITNAILFASCISLFSMVGCSNPDSVVVEETLTEEEQAQAYADYDKQMSGESSDYESQN